MTHTHKAVISLLLLGALFASTAHAQEKPTVGLIPKAQKPITLDQAAIRIAVRPDTAMTELHALGDVFLQQTIDECVGERQT